MMDFYNQINFFINKLVRNFHLILLVSAVLLSSSSSMGRLADGKEIEIRFEDILIAFLILASVLIFFLSGKRKIKKPPFLYIILALVGFGFFTTLLNWMLGYLPGPRAFFYFLKEIELFLFYFYFFYHIKSVNQAKFIINLIIVLAAVNTVFVFYQILKGQNYRYGEYGTAAISEWGVLPTAAFFLIIFLFLFNIFIYYILLLDISKIKKSILGVMILSLIVGIFGAGSKTVLLAFIFSLVLTFLFLTIKKKSFKLIIPAILILIVMIGTFYFVISRVETLKRYQDLISFSNLVSNFKTGRWNETKLAIEEALDFKSPLFYVLGLGKGIFSEAHSQYGRNLIETGIIGSMLFFIMIFLILRRLFASFLKNRDPFLLGLVSGLLVINLTMLFISFATEPFIVAKPAELYWIFTGITMALINGGLGKNHEVV